MKSLMKKKKYERGASSHRGEEEGERE